MTFTPAPWFTLDGTVMSAASGTVCHMEKSNPDRAHNAKLIAAAPDMLDALYHARNALSRRRHEARNVINEAIDKATKSN